MKKFVTAFLIVLATMGASRVSAQMTAVDPKPQSIGINIPRTYTSPVFLPQAAPLLKTQTLSYFTDTSETGANYFFGNDTIQGTDGNDYFTWGYAERFSTSFEKPYLDSIHFQFEPLAFPATLQSGAANKMVVQVVRQRFDTGGQFPDIPRVDLGQNALATANILPTKIVEGEVNNVTVKFGHKLLPKTNGEQMKDFFVFVSRFSDENQIAFQFDNVQDAQRDLDIETDRALYVGLNADNSRYINGYMSGRYHLVSDESVFIYPNLIMEAFMSEGAATAVKPGQPEGFRLAQNYPNPFNPSTSIHYALGERTHVTIKVKNALGQEVATVVDGIQNVGEKSVKFNASNLPSGTYYYTINAGAFTATRRMILAK